MSGCCGRNRGGASCGETAPSLPPWRRGAAPAAAAALDHFGGMIDRCVEYCSRAKSEGRPIVGIMCEYTPREVILAAGAVPVCLCGGSAETIPAAEEILPTNLCPLIKSTFGYHCLKSNPLLEMADLVVAETTCDGKKKMYELLGQTREVYVLELPQKQNDDNARKHWHREVVKLKELLEQRFGAAITPDRLRTAVQLMNRERALRRELGELLQSDAPPLTGRQLLELKSSVSGIAADLEQYEKLLAALKSSATPCVHDASSRIRVLLTGVPIVHGAEHVLETIEAAGGLVVCMENCTGLKPILEDVAEQISDPLQAIADKYYHLPCSVQTPNPSRLQLLQDMFAKYRPHCVIELIWLKGRAITART